MKSLKYSIIVTVIGAILAGLTAFLFQRLNTAIDQRNAAYESQKVLISDVQHYKDKFGVEHTLTIQANVRISDLQNSKDSLQRKIYTLFSQTKKSQQKRTDAVIGASIGSQSTVDLIQENKTDSCVTYSFNDTYLKGTVELCKDSNKLSYNSYDTLYLSIQNYKDKWKLRNLLHKRPVKNKVDAQLSNPKARIGNIYFFKPEK